MIARDPARERDDLAAALKPLMPTIDFYIGPNARSLSGHVEEYRRLQLALRRAMGEPCPECNDTGRSRIYTVSSGSYPCSLRHEPNHLIDLPADVVAYMTTRRDEDLAEDAKPYEERARRGFRVGPPRFEAELAEMGVQ